MSRAQEILETYDEYLDQEEISELAGALARFLNRPGKNTSTVGIGTTQVAQRYGGVKRLRKGGMHGKRAFSDSPARRSNQPKPVSTASKIAGKIKGVHTRGAERLGKMQQAQRDTNLPVPKSQAGARARTTGDKAPNIAQKVAGRARDAVKTGAGKYSKYRQTDKKTNLYTGNVPSGAKPTTNQARPQQPVMRAQLQPRTRKALGL